MGCALPCGPGQAALGSAAGLSVSPWPPVQLRAEQAGITEVPGEGWREEERSLRGEAPPARMGEWTSGPEQPQC